MNVIEAGKQGKLHQLPDEVQQESEDRYMKFRGVQRGMLVNECSLRQDFMKETASLVLSIAKPTLK